jgi:Fe-S-cluster containining protein
MLARGFGSARAEGGGVKYPWWSEGLYFSCVGCGACCGREPGTVSFTAAELSNMASLLGVSEKEFTLLYAWRKYGVLSLREEPNYDCVFLRKTKSASRCMIYASRPAQCAVFPFWPEILESRESWDRYALSCPGMNAGAFHGAEEVSKTAAGYLLRTVANFL